MMPKKGFKIQKQTNVIIALLSRVIFAFGFFVNNIRFFLTKL